MNVVDLDLGGKVAIVTAGGQGIGKGIAETLAAHGAITIVTDADPERAAEVARAIKANGGEAWSIEVDVSKPSDVERMARETLATYNTVDILVNNAGIGSAHEVADLTPDSWHRTLEVNLTGTLLCCQAVLPEMRRKRSGKIINISSTAAKRMSQAGGADYTASKEGVLGLTRHLAYEVAPDGVNVNAVCPGVVETPRLAWGRSQGLFDAEHDPVRMVPMGRLGTAEDVANAVLFLASDLSDYICGIALDVDGGALLGWVDVETYRAAKRRSTGDSASAGSV